jgi:hypothetical protein
VWEHNIVNIEVEDTDHNDDNDDNSDENEGDDLNKKNYVKKSNYRLICATAKSIATTQVQYWSLHSRPRQGGR